MMNTSNDLIYKITVTIDRFKEFQNVKDWLIESFGIQLSEANTNGIWSYFTYSVMTMNHPEILDIEVGFINEIDAMHSS